MMPAQDFRSLFQGYKFGWFGMRALDCLGLEQYMDLDMVLSCDFGTSTEALKLRDVQTFTIEEQGYVRELWSTLLLEKYIEQNEERLRRALQSNDHRRVMIAYSASAGMDQFMPSVDPRTRLLMPTPRIKTDLDDKFRFQQMLAELQIPQIENHLENVESGAYARHASRVGPSFVLSLQFGSAGNSTFFIHDEDTYEHVCLKFPDAPAKFSRFIDGVSININGAIMGHKVVVSYPSVQLVGLEGCTTRPEVYCGNDFGSIKLVSPELLFKAQEYLLQIGKWMAGYGYQGIFGVDMLVDTGRGVIYPVDLNPRFNNSTLVLTQIDTLDNITPLPVRYVAYQLGLIPEEEIEDEIQEQPKREVSQMILHSINEPSVVRGEIQPGFYRVEGGRLVKCRDGISLLDAPLNPDEFLLTCAIPRAGTLVKTGASMIKLVIPQRVVDIRTGQLQPWARAMVDTVYSALEMEPVEAQHGPSAGESVPVMA